MERSECSAWSLAGGALCLFVLAVLLKDLATPVVLAVLAVAVGLWSLYARVWAGAALGVIAWLLLTGFEVGGTGDLVFSGVADAVRLGLLVASGVAGSLVGGLQWVHRSSGVSDDRYYRAFDVTPDGRRAVPPAPVSEDPTKESSDV